MANNYFDFIGQNAGEEKKEAPQQTQAMANVTVRCDADCFLLCDGEYLDIQLVAGKMAKIQVPIGQHLLEFLYTEDSDIKIEKEVDFPESGKSYLVITKGLKDLVDGANAEAQAKAAEAEAKKKAEEAEARRLEELRILELQKEPYAVLSNNNETLTFYYDHMKSNRNGMDIDNEAWLGHRGGILEVIFDESFANCHYIRSTNGWFYCMFKLKSIQGLNYLDTSNVTDMKYMFYFCQTIEIIDLKDLNTSNVVDMSLMFSGCNSLQSLDLSNFNTEHVTNMEYMFSCCLDLVNLDLSNFNTSNVVNMQRMFENCENLVNLDLSNFNTNNVVNMSGMFCGCESLKTLKTDKINFNTDNVTDMEDMFNGCSNLEHIDEELRKKAETYENLDPEVDFRDIFG